MIETIGWIGGLLLAFCGLPMAIKSFRDGNSDGVSKLFLVMWLLGEIALLVYVLIKHGFDLPLVTNYLLNIAFISIIGYYVIKPRRL
jgi:uncharacterized protein with PQ loop repeat